MVKKRVIILISDGIICYLIQEFFVYRGFRKRRFLIKKYEYLDLKKRHLYLKQEILILRRLHTRRMASLCVASDVT